MAKNDELKEGVVHVDSTGLLDAETLAKQFHETYERLAPQFGYKTREETRQFQKDTPNGRLMIAVCSELLATLSLTCRAHNVDRIDGRFHGKVKALVVQLFFFSK